MYNVNSKTEYVSNKLSGEFKCGATNFGGFKESDYMESTTEPRYCFCQDDSVTQLPALPLSTKGSKIVDANDDEIKLRCTNWYGAHMQRYVVNGLDKVPMDFVSKSISGLGFNCVRMPYSLEQVVKNPLVNSEHLKANPELMSLTSMEILDKTIESLTNNGVMVILNNHIGEAKWCCDLTDGNGLWYNKEYPEETWLKTLGSLTKRYLSNPGVIGNDLRNELRADIKNLRVPSWGSGHKTTDWKIAAQKGAKAVHEVNESQLIFVEGLSYATDLSGVYWHPLKLSVPNKLIYSAHAYSWELSWYKYYSWTKFTFDRAFGYITEEGKDYTAPVWIGEFGANKTQNFWTFLMKYLGDNDLSWSQWAFNGDKDDDSTKDGQETFGIVDSSYKKVQHKFMLMDLLQFRKPKSKVNSKSESKINFRNKNQFLY